MVAVASAVVAVTYVVSQVVNYAGLAAMAGMSVAAFWHAPKGERKAAVVGAARTTRFWLAFWLSGAAWLVNTLCPLLLVPFSPAAGWSLFAVNAALNVAAAVPVRGAILWATLRARSA